MIRIADLERTFRYQGPVQPPPQMPQQYPPHPQQVNPRLAAEQRERMRRLAMQPTDKNMPDGVDDVCIGDAVKRYRELREVERSLDSALMRKKLEVSDQLVHPRAPRYGTLRIWVSNTAENQPWQGGALDADAFDFETGTNATYRVKIQGRLLDDSDVGLGEDEGEKDPDAIDDDAEAATPKPAQKPKVFSQFFSAITIDFDRAKSLQPDNFTQIEWKQPDPADRSAKEALFSELEFERKGDENINVTINLQRKQMPERYRLSKELSELLDTDEEDRVGVMTGIWDYARAHHLQQDDDERKFMCDAKLKALFGGRDMFFFPDVPALLKPHLTTQPPVQLQYTIRVDKDYISPDPDSGIQPSRPSVYDVQVALDDPVRPLMHELLHPKGAPETLMQIKTIDEQIALLIAAIGQSKAKHAFFTSMAKDPVAFVKRWLSSQKRDLEVMLGEAVRGGGEDASGGEWHVGGTEGAWNSDVARESVSLWLARADKLQPAMR